MRRLCLPDHTTQPATTWVRFRFSFTAVCRLEPEAKIRPTKGRSRAPRSAASDTHENPRIALYEASLLARQTSEIAALRASTEQTARQLHEFASARDRAAARLKDVDQQIDTRLLDAARTAALEPALEAKLTEWLAQLDRLKEFLAANPNLNIPELRLLDESEWLHIIAAPEPGSSAELRPIASRLRLRAETIMANKLGAALRAYVAANAGALPNEVAALLPHFDPPIDAALLARYEMLRTGKFSDLPRQQRPTALIAPRAPADPEYDKSVRVGINGAIVTSRLAVDEP